MSGNSDGLKMHTAFLRFVSLALTKDRLPGRLPDTALAAAEEAGALAAVELLEEPPQAARPSAAAPTPAAFRKERREMDLDMMISPSTKFRVRQAVRTERLAFDGFSISV